MDDQMQKASEDYIRAEMQHADMLDRAFANTADVLGIAKDPVSQVYGKCAFLMGVLFLHDCFMVAGGDPELIRALSDKCQHGHNFVTMVVKPVKGSA